MGLDVMVKYSKLFVTSIIELKQLKAPHVVATNNDQLQAVENKAFNFTARPQKALHAISKYSCETTHN